MSLQYPNPPIREAVCEFRYKEDGHWDGASAGLIYSVLSAEFPRRLAGETPNTASTSPSGSPNLLPAELQQMGLGLRLVPQGALKFWREGDDSGYVSVAPYRISVHLFKPYPSWKSFHDTIRRCVQTYGEVHNSAEIQRIGLRYINDIYFSDKSISLEEFFDFYPFVGFNLHKELTGFQCLVQLNFESGRDLLNLQIGSAADADGQNPRVVLDLDYFLGSPDRIKTENGLDWLEQAHTNLEGVFEGCLKDPTRALFQ